MNQRSQEIHPFGGDFADRYLKPALAPEAAPPAPTETERPQSTWNVSLREVLKPRDWRDVGMISARIASDFWSPLGVLLMTGMTSAMLVKEIKTVKEIRSKLKDLASPETTAADWLKQKGLTQEDLEAVQGGAVTKWGLGRLGDKLYFRQTSFGRVFSQQEGSKLKSGERIGAGLYGIFGTLGLVILTEAAGLTPFLGKGVKRAVLMAGGRVLSQWLMPKIGVYLTQGLVFRDKEDSYRKEKAQEWVDLALKTSSAAMTIWTTVAFLPSAIPAAQGLSRTITESFRQSQQAESPSIAIITPTPTSEEAKLEATQRAIYATQMATQPTPEAPPIPEVTPTPVELNWHPGQEPTSQQLQQLTDSAGGLDKVDHVDNVPVHDQAQTIYRFNLDNDPEPDVWAVYNNQTHQFQPFVWEDKGHLYKADLDLNGQPDPGNLLPQWLKDNHLWPSGQGGGGERAPLLEGGNVNCDLNNDGQNDLAITIINNEEKWFLNRDGDPDLTFDHAKDLLLEDQPVFSLTTGKVLALEAFDGQKWWRGTDGKMMGLLRGAGDIVYYLDREANPLQPDFDDNIVVEPLADMKLDLKAVSGDQEGFQLDIKNANILFGDGGRWDSRWEYDSNGLGKGYLVDGRTLAFDRAGDKGIMAWQYQLALAHPDWTPDEVAKEAFRHQSEPININIPRPEPYRAPGGTLEWPNLVKTEAGGQEGVIQGQLWNNGNPNLNASQAAQAASVAVMNGHTSGPAMIADVNTNIARFSLENVFGSRMTEKIEQYGLKPEYISGYATRAAWVAMQDSSVGWQIPNDTIKINETLGADLIKNWSSQNWNDWLEEWLRENGYID